MTVIKPDRTFPTETQAWAATLDFAKLVTRAGRTLTGGSSGGLF